MNPINNIWNCDYIQQQAQQFHSNQVRQINNSTLKLRDFLNSLDEIAPTYQNIASAEFCTVILEYFAKHSNQ